MSETIRILHIITRMVRGGAQENTLANVTRINGDGWNSALATGPALGPEGSLEPECEAAGVRLIQVPHLVREIAPLHDLRALRYLKKVIRMELPHIVHTHTSKAGILGRIAARSCRVPVVIHTPHGHVFHSYENRFKTEAFIRTERWCAARAERLVALTENEKREHLQLRIGAPEQWSVVHSGIDFGPFVRAPEHREAVRAELGIPSDAPLIGTVGRLVPIKGQQYLVEAYARLARRRPDLHLVLVGDGELHRRLVDQARSLNVPVIDHTAGRQKPGSPGVHFTGLRRDVFRLMSAMDIFALPSLNEGMGRVLAEAMAVGLPCVASRVSGTPDVVEEGVTGLLVTPRDSAALETALEKLLADRNRAFEMGRRGRERALGLFSVERMTQMLENLYRDELARKGIVAPPSRILEPSCEC
jgi:glycosyltransferase involved in cell wall biosynthesis